MSIGRSREEMLLEDALELARLAEQNDDVPVGALVVDSAGNVVGRGWNVREKHQNPTGHAEIQALEDAGRNIGSWRLIGCTLYATLEPCPMCLGACQQSRIDRIVYGAADPKGGALSLGYRIHEDDRLNHRFRAELVSVPGCERILKEFFRKKRDKKSEG